MYDAQRGRNFAFIWRGRIPKNMDYADFMKSGLGAVIGFVLAQLVNLAGIIWKWCRRPRLRIEPLSGNGNWLILMHYPDQGNDEPLNEKMYGFYVRNVGRTIATCVRFQIIRVECRKGKCLGFSECSHQAQDLAIYTNSTGKRGAEMVTLVPGARVLVHLGSWREDYGVVFPGSISVPDYYEEICTGASEYRFTVVAFDDRAHFKSAVAIIRTS